MMKEYLVAHNTNAEVLTKALNSFAKKGWVPTHFAIATDSDADTFALLLERDSRDGLAAPKVSNVYGAHEETPDVH